jgi:hypothetical protein
VLMDSIVMDLPEFGRRAGDVGFGKPGDRSAICWTSVIIFRTQTCILTSA